MFHVPDREEPVPVHIKDRQALRYLENECVISLRILTEREGSLNKFSNSLIGVAHIDARALLDI